jgi:heme exporter protein C
MSKLNQLELALAGLMLAVSPWIIDGAPYEVTMGLVQKIFYYHMPAAWLFLISAAVAGVASAMFLFGRKRWADGWALAAAELAVVFGIITLVTGPLWARKAWGIWWVWDARLTSSLILWMIFVSYLLLRKYGGPGSDKLGAGMALFGLANVPFIFVSVNVWRTLHPQTSVVPTLPVQMGGPLWFCFFAFLLLYLALLGMRARLEQQRARIEYLYLAEDEA